MMSPFNVQGEEKRRAFWSSFQGERLRFNSTSANKVLTTLRFQGITVANAVQSAGHISELETIVDRTIAKTEPNVEAMLVAVHQVVGLHFARETYAGLSKAATLEEQKAPKDLDDRWLRAIRQHVTSKHLKVVEITATSGRILKKIVKEAIADGKSIPDIAREIRTGSGIHETYRHRSIVIARTEVISASNFGSQEGARTTGLRLSKSWLATKDERTRDDHADADGQTRNLEDAYEVGGEGLMFPGDPDGSPENVIQCRCAETYQTSS